MNRTLASFVSAAFGLVLAPVASAGIQVNVTQVAPPFSAPEAGLTGFSAYQVDVASTAGELITAVDVAFSGPLHQRWVDADFEFVPNDPTPNGPVADGRGDSHLTMIAGALVGSAASEDNSGTGSPLVSNASLGYGLGSFLTGAWGIPGEAQSTLANIAYLVIPEGQLVNYDFAVSTSQGTFNSAGVIPVPEPGAIALLVLGGGLGLCGRRRAEQA